MPKIILIPVEQDRKIIGCDAFKLPTSACDSPLSYQAGQLFYWHNETQQLRTVLRIFYDKVRTLSDDPQFAFTAADLESARELLPMTHQAAIV